MGLLGFPEYIYRYELLAATPEPGDALTHRLTTSPRTNDNDSDFWLLVDDELVCHSEPKAAPFLYTLPLTYCPTMPVAYKLKVIVTVPDRSITNSLTFTQDDVPLLADPVTV